MDTNDQGVEFTAYLQQPPENPNTITVNVPDHQNNEAPQLSEQDETIGQDHAEPTAEPICQSCLPGEGKTITTNEKGECIVCGKQTQGVMQDTQGVTSDNLVNFQAIPSEERNPGEMIEAIQGEIVEQKNKGGRPSKYNEEMLQKAKDYYDYCRGRKDGKKHIPFIEELALECGVDDGTIVNWADAKDENGNYINEEFFTTYKNLMTLQKLRYVQNGLGAKNPTFSIFMLKANHGMMETEKRILSGERNSEPMQVTINEYTPDKQIPSSVAQQVIEEGSE